MFSSKISTKKGQAGQIIHYVNALPGAGKTWTFDHHIARPHVEDKHNSLLVYAAPTDRLLDERHEALIRLGVSPKRMVRISSRNTELNVVEDFRTALAGHGDIRARPDGTIILCTHECLARLPDDINKRERVVVVYDEARACLQDNYALHLPDDVFQFLTEPREHLTDGGRRLSTRLISKVPIFEKSSGADSESIYIWKWSNHRIPLPTVKEIQDHLPKTVRSKERARNIRDFLSNIHSSSLDVYVSIERKQAQAEYVVSNVFSPSRMFRGFSKVLILSAFFESSQMYQFLAKSNQIDRTPLTLKDITRKYVDRKRLIALLERMRNVRLTYVYDLGDRTLTKSEMQQAVVVQAKIDAETAKKIHCAWHDVYPTKPETYRSVYNSFSEEGDRALYMSDFKRAPAFKILRAMDRRFTLLGGVIPHMVDTSIKLQQAFMKRAKLPYESLPIGINPRYNSYKEGDSKIWDAEELDAFNQRDRLYKRPEKGEIIMRLPISAHGLNAFRDLHSCAFLASMKYSRREHTFLKRTIAEYNPAVDRTLDYALQLLWRCNVRMPNEDPVLLIVTDRKLAETLHKRFHDLATDWLGRHYSKDVLARTLNSERPVLPVVSPMKLLPDYKLPSVLRYEFDTAESQKRRNDNRKTTVRGQEAAELKKLYTKSEEGSNYARLTNQIAYAKKNNKTTTDLEAERRKYRTFAQWKITGEGIAAASSLNEVQTFDKRASAADALRRLDMVALSRSDPREGVLKIMSVIKRNAPELKSQIKAMYPGDRFEHNWSTCEKYGKTYNLGWLFKQAQTFAK